MKPLVPRSSGVNHSNRPAAPQRTYCAVPPSAPPARTIRPANKLKGASVRIAWTALADRGLREERAVQDDDEQIGRAEGQSRAGERVRDRQREHEVRAHGGQQDEPPRRRCWH